MTTYKSNAFCGFTAIKCVYTNLCGTSLSYIFDNYTDVLTIYGVGNMYNYTIDSVPWISFKDFMKSVVISYGVESIVNNAFSNRNELSSITIPSSVKSIGNFAFSNCSNLDSVTYNGINDPGINSNAFYDCNKLIKVNLHANFIVKIYSTCKLNQLVTNNSNTIICFHNFKI